MKWLCLLNKSNTWTHVKRQPSTRILSLLCLQTDLTGCRFVFLQLRLCCSQFYGPIQLKYRSKFLFSLLRCTFSQHDAIFSTNFSHKLLAATWVARKNGQAYLEHGFCRKLFVAPRFGRPKTKFGGLCHIFNSIELKSPQKQHQNILRRHINCAKYPKNYLWPERKRSCCIHKVAKKSGDAKKTEIICAVAWIRVDFGLMRSICIVPRSCSLWMETQMTCLFSNYDKELILINFFFVRWPLSAS